MSTERGCSRLAKRLTANEDASGSDQGLGLHVTALLFENWSAETHSSNGTAGNYCQYFPLLPITGSGLDVWREQCPTPVSKIICLNQVADREAEMLLGNLMNRMMPRVLGHDSPYPVGAFQREGGRERERERERGKKAMEGERSKKREK